MSGSKFNLHRINGVLLKRLPSDGEIDKEVSIHHFNKMSMIRKSKFRHVFGRVGRKEECYEGLKTVKISQDGNVCAVNAKFIAVVVESAGGGVFTVLPLQQTGRVPVGYPKICGHTGPVTDIKWNPFDDNVIASCSDDTTIKLWKIPDSGLTDDLTDWLKDLQGHLKKVGHLEWHPTACDILLSAGSDLMCIVWNVATETMARILCLHTDSILSVAWNRDGSLFATTSKDKKIRVIDPRKEAVTAQVEGHQGSKASKVIFLDKKRLLTTGFSRLSERQFAIWDIDNMYKPLKLENLDTSSGVMTPYYDFDTKVLFVAGKGDGNIRYYEVVPEAPYVHYLSQYLSSSPQGGLAQMPKKGVDTRKCEIVRFYKLHTMKDVVEPLSMIVPRKSELFQEDLFPPTSGVTSSMSAEEWLSGVNRAPVLTAFEEILRNSSTARGKTTAKERDTCGSGMPENTNSRADPRPLVCRNIPGSIRNIMRLSGMDFQSFLNDRKKQLDDEKPVDGDNKISYQRDNGLVKNIFDKYSTLKLDNQKPISVNNNYPHLSNGIPKAEEELRKAFLIHANEIKHLRDEIVKKDVRIQELEKELKILRVTRNAINNARAIN